ncbi:hypothetical protein [Flexibacterium corallicola]|uniref:hypothetical protein n=1 Tax=Flexibacterium corallicola TaxID=3037259 RepID=UPI00286EDA39|nr:hypothetical protein [Pseudovibrio sp. M1P-2-3]
MTNKVLEVVEFKLNSGANPEEFLQQALAAEEFIKSLDGCEGRYLTAGEDGLWADIVQWRDMDAASHASKVFPKAEQVQGMMKMIDGQTVRLQHLTVQKMG